MNTFLSKVYYFKSFLRFKRYGKNIMFSKNGKFIRPNEIVFGNNIFINASFYISARNLVFGSNIMIGPGLVIECDNHMFNKVGLPMFKYNNEKIIKPVVIEDDVWIGANVIILPGVKIGEGCIIGAGSVLTKSLPPYTICVGNPCKPIKKRFSNDDMINHMNNVKTTKYKFDEIIYIWKSNNL